MIWLGVILFATGGWVCIQSTTTRFAPAIAVAGLVIMVLCWPAKARDLGQWESGDPAIKEWYQSLMQPDNPNASCCGEADAYFCDDYRIEKGKAVCTVSDERDDAERHRPHIDVGTVIEIPNHKLKWDRSNPTGRGVVFLSRMLFVFCYVQAGGA